MKRIHLGRVFAKTCKFIIGFIPKNKNLILFSAWFGKKYVDSSMYEFEYFLKHSSKKVFWYTKNKDLYKELKQKGIPVLYSKTLKGAWYQIRACMLVSSIQFDDYNRFLLKNCIYLDLDHGFWGKNVGIKLPSAQKTGGSWYLFCKSGVDMYQTASGKSTIEHWSPCFDIQPDHYIFCNKPRIDVLFDKELQQGKNEVVEKIKDGKRMVAYLPTHRSSGRKQMRLNDILDLDRIQKLCEQKDFVFVIKKHFYHRNEEENLEKYPSIYDITHETIDTQVLLTQSDVLVTDFSSCFIDYLTLDRPIIYYAYDYDEYMAKERDYYWKYDKITAGYTTKTKGDFNKALDSVTKDWVDVEHKEGRKTMREVYFDPEVEMGTTREKLMGIMEELIEGTYVPYDWSKK